MNLTNKINPVLKTESNVLIQDKIRKESGPEALEFIQNESNSLLENLSSIAISGKNEQHEPSNSPIRTCIALKTLNQEPHLNDYLAGINHKLEDAAIFIGCFEGYSERKERIYLRYPKFLAKMIWVLDFIINRSFSKMALTKKIYFFLSGNKHIALSKAEALGRLCYAGFDIIGCEKIGNLIYFSVIKTGPPKTTKVPASGLFFKMKRISVGGKIIGVYKIRTMHPYSEYLHEYVVKMNGYNKTGKPNNDFRLTSWGKLIRKFYLDEIPQLINVLKGDLGIVGVRPISQSGFKALPEDLQVERVKYKPGCIPPNVSLGITGFDGVIRAERIYLKQMGQHKFATNFKYFWMAIVNIISRKSHSA